jgi:hypothetical protein
VPDVPRCTVGVCGRSGSPNPDALYERSERWVGPYVCECGTEVQEAQRRRGVIICLLKPTQGVHPIIQAAIDDRHVERRDITAVRLALQVIDETERLLSISVERIRQPEFCGRSRTSARHRDRLSELEDRVARTTGQIVNLSEAIVRVREVRIQADRRPALRDCLWGAKTRSPLELRAGPRLLGGAVTLSVLYVAFQRVLQLFLLLFRSPEFKELEIVVLRHELAALRRHVGRPTFRSSDRWFLAAAARTLPG